jgi:hypothetical protein
MNKQEIVASILHRLREEFESRSRVSKLTRDGGNDAESKAEGNRSAPRMSFSSSSIRPGSTDFTAPPSGAECRRIG